MVETKKSPTPLNKELSNILLALPNVTSELSKSSKIKWSPHIGFAGERACQIARDVLSDNKIDGDKESKILNDILSIFEQWKNEYGVYPPKKQHYGLLGSMLGGLEKKNCLLKENEVQLSAKEYCKRMIDRPLLGQNIPTPWECCDNIRTPIGLLWKLFLENYTPLLEYTYSDRYFDTMLALMILFTAKTDPSSPEYIEAGFSLASFRINYLKTAVDNMLPDAYKIFLMKERVQIKKEERQKEKEQIILEAYEGLCANGQNPPSLQKTIHHQTGYSQSTVSRALTKHGINKRSKKRIS